MQNLCDDSVESKTANIESNSVTKLNQNTPHPYLDFLEVRQKIGFTDKLAIKKIAHIEEKETALQKEWAELEEEEKSFGDIFTTFNQFLCTNRAKRERLMKKIELDEALYKERSKDVEALRKRYDALKIIVRRMEYETKKHGKFCTFIHECSSYFELKQPLDIVHLFELYISTREKLCAKEESSMEFLRKLGNNMLNMFEINRNTITGLHNQLSAMLQRYDDNGRKLRMYENISVKIKVTCADHWGEITENKNSITNIYNSINERLNYIFESASRTNLFQQLIRIKTTLQSFDQSIQRRVGNKKRNRKSIRPSRGV